MRLIFRGIILATAVVSNWSIDQSVADEQQLLAEIVEASNLNQLSYRNFEVSVKHTSISLRTPIESKDQKESKSVRVVRNELLHLWMDYEIERVAFVAQTKQSEENSDGTPVKTQKVWAQSGEQRFQVEMSRFGGLHSIMVGEFKDGVGVVYSRQGDVQNVSFPFYQFLDRFDVPRLELTCTTNRYPVRCTVSTLEKQLQKQALSQNVRSESGVRKLIDGTKFVSHRLNDTIATAHYEPTRAWPHRIVLSDNSNGKEKIVQEVSVIYDDFPTVDRPTSIRIEKHETVEDFYRGSKIHVDRIQNIELVWHQFNSDVFEWPTIDVIAKSEESIQKFLADKFD